MGSLYGIEGGAVREQEVHTPDWILDAVREAFGGRIWLDPCAPSDPAAWFAYHNVTIPLAALRAAFPPSPGRPWTAPPPEVLSAWLAERGYPDGLAIPWDPAGTFWNPPYRDLGAWIAHNGRQAGRRIYLGPFRPHRAWFLPGLSGSQVTFLDYNVRFKGHSSAAPFPLILAAWSCTIPPLGRKETGRWRVP